MRGVLEKFIALFSDVAHTQVESDSHTQVGSDSHTQVGSDSEEDFVKFAVLDWLSMHPPDCNVAD